MYVTPKTQEQEAQKGEKVNGGPKKRRKKEHRQKRRAQAEKSAKKGKGTSDFQRWRCPAKPELLTSSLSCSQRQCSVSCSVRQCSSAGQRAMPLPPSMTCQTLLRTHGNLSSGGQLPDKTGVRHHLTIRHVAYFHECMHATYSHRRIKQSRMPVPSHPGRSSSQ